MNMSYCRFQNTLAAFNDCLANLHDPDISDDERAARYALIQSALEMIQLVGVDTDDEDAVVSWKVAELDAPMDDSVDQFIGDAAFVYGDYLRRGLGHEKAIQRVSQQYGPRVAAAIEAGLE